MHNKLSIFLGKVKNGLLHPIYAIYQKRLRESVKGGRPPTHIGFILDGNRRFALSKGMDKRIGHRFGARKVEELLEWCFDLDIKVVTIYAFSTENFNRSTDEVDALMGLAKLEFEKVLTSENIHKNQVRVKALGNMGKLPAEVRESIKRAEETTKDYDRHFLNVCVAYGSLDEVVNAVRKIAYDVKDGRLDPAEIDYDVIRSNLLTKEHPDPDMIIRTGGQSRLSNFMLLQAAYAELFFIDVYLPEFRKIDLLRIIRDYQKIDRRYGR